MRKDQVVLVVTLVLVLIGLIIFIVLYALSRKRKDTVVVLPNATPTTTSTDDYRPVIISRCSLKKMDCDSSSSSSSSSCGCDSSSSSSSCGSCDSSDSSSSTCHGCSSSSSSSSSCNDCDLSGSCGKCDLRDEITDSGDSCEPCKITNASEYYTYVDEKVVSIGGGIKPHNVHDIAEYHGKVLVVPKSDKKKIIIRRQGEDNVTVTSSLSIERIFYFQGDVYIINGGTIYIRDPECNSGKKWYWYKCNLPTGVFWISVTGDDKHLWIQTTEGLGYLYNCKRKLVDTVTMDDNVIRFYGTYKDDWSTLNTSDHVMYITEYSRSFADVRCCSYLWSNNIIYVKEAQKNLISGIRIVYYKPYFLFT